MIGWLIYWVRDHLKTGFSRSYRAWDAMTSILADTIPGIRVVKAFAQEGREIERFRRSQRRDLPHQQSGEHGVGLLLALGGVLESDWAWW